MSRAPSRLPAGGRIDRNQPVTFTLEGRQYSGYAGDTLASALLANGISLVARSFKYHRPRGFIAAGVEEPNGLFTLGNGGRTTPNVPGTTVELHAGLVAARQNGFPSIEFDLMAVNQWFAPVLGAGFYYKTFMGPRRGSWMFYEPFIRRAAGLGAGTYERDPDRYETAHVYTDVLVVGAGPAGLAAARAAGLAGARVLLVEQDFLAGGSLLSAPVDSGESEWRAQAVAELARMRNVQVRLRTTAFGLYDGDTVGLVERRDALRPNPERGEAREVLTTARAGSIILATGAYERPLVFGDNDRPGIVLAGAAETYANRYGVLLGRQAVVLTNNDRAWTSALALAVQGSAVTVVEQRRTVDAALLASAEAAKVAVILGGRAKYALGGKHVEGVVVAAGSSDVRLHCDLLCMSGGYAPVVHLSSHTGIKPLYRADIDAFVPGGHATRHASAGAANGTLDGWAAIIEGHDAGVRAVGGAAASAVPSPTLPAGPVHRYSLQPVPVPELPQRGKAFIDFQGDVGLKDVHVAHQEGYVSVEHLKRYTTLGMGTDQGKTSNVNAIGVMANLRSLPVPATGTTTFRPPFSPLTVGALAGRAVGHHFRPIRRSPLHDWHVANGATLIEAGPWLRAWFYSWAGSTAASAYVEEMKLVRGGVGIADVSSLGKIDVQGPDAAEFLNRVYVNGFAKLPVGKARYGVMLNDDATVLDDGTTARFGETRYFMTTTTAQAAEVMSHLEFLLQTAWPELNVAVTSLTDQWAGMSVAGPKACEALALALPGVDLADGSLPHMGVREVEFDGLPLRILRLSFSGELAYELYVPADYGIALWEHVLKEAEPLGIRPYGLEALASLRIEKGHAAGLELDHRTTLDDLGLGKMASREKAFVGRELRLRPELQAPERWSLVGIECLEDGARLRGGAILFAAGEPVKGHGRGYITSVTWSIELGKYVALGLYDGGLRHEGEEIVCAFPLKGEQVRARIVSPIFIDAKGERLHV